MKIGFLNNQIDNRGTGNAMFDYAHYNEALLGNESIIFTFPNGAHDVLALKRYEKRFGKMYDVHSVNQGLDAIYHIKSGENDGISFGTLPYLVHSVFANDPHGTRYATVSLWAAHRFGLPYVPHIVGLPNHHDSIRADSNIPDSAIVFGRHGGADTFDIPFVWDAIKKITEERDDIWFLLMNTNKPSVKLNDHVVFVEPTANAHQKRAFINSCDAMIHARSRGETFGIAVGEFAFCGKPVITYGDSGERAHLFELGDNAVTYESGEQLYEIFDNFVPYDVPPRYTEFTPEKVMAQFKVVFLGNGIDTRSGAFTSSRW